MTFLAAIILSGLPGCATAPYADNSGDFAAYYCPRVDAALNVDRQDGTLILTGYPTTVAVRDGSASVVFGQAKRRYSYFPMRDCSTPDYLCRDLQINASTAPIKIFLPREIRFDRLPAEQVYSLDGRFGLLTDASDGKKPDTTVRAFIWQGPLGDGPPIVLTFEHRRGVLFIDGFDPWQEEVVTVAAPTCVLTSRHGLFRQVRVYPPPPDRIDPIY